MIAVIFEVIPRAGQKEAYLAIAAHLRAELETIEGYISIERFVSLSTPGKMLSLSFWRDEEAVARWRNMGDHRQAQQQGRETVFDDYRLRVASVMRDYSMAERSEVPADSQQVHDSGKAGSS